VGYEQSDAGFSQLVSAMEKDGQIVREIKGKRTFAISGTKPRTPQMGAEQSEYSNSDGGIDYEDLAAALLVRTAKVLANAQEPMDGAGWARRRIEQLERRIDELERELARAKAEARTFTDERDDLRGQLEAASHNLNLLTEQSGRPKQGRAVQRLGSEEQAVLHELRRRSLG
jgi:hypothetical protein